MPEHKICPLCVRQNFQQDILYETTNFVVLYILEQNFYPLLRIICKNHFRELSDLPNEMQQELFALILRCENAMLNSAAISPPPEKINIASLGNYVPHLHFHIIARWENDLHFPDAIWANPKNEANLKNLKISVNKNLLQDFLKK